MFSLNFWESGKPLLKGNFGGACWLIELILLSRKVQATRRKRVFWSRFFFYLFFSKDVIPDSISIKNRSSVHFTSTWSWYDTSYHEAHFLGTIRKNFLCLIPFKTNFQFMLHPRDTMHHLFSIFWVQPLGARLTTPEKASFQWQWRNWFDSFQNRSSVHVASTWYDAPIFNFLGFLGTNFGCAVNHSRRTSFEGQWRNCNWVVTRAWSILLLRWM